MSVPAVAASVAVDVAVDAFSTIRVVAVTARLVVDTPVAVFRGRVTGPLRRLRLRVAVDVAAQVVSGICVGAVSVSAELDVAADAASGTVV